MTPAVESLLGVVRTEEDELGQPPDYHDLSLPQSNIFPADFQYLNQHNRSLIKQEVVSYIDKTVLGPEERDEVMAKYDTSGSRPLVAVLLRSSCLTSKLSTSRTLRRSPSSASL